MKIIVSLASGANNTERMILRSFYEGLEKYYFARYKVSTTLALRKASGIILILHYDPEVPACDIAVQFGTVKDRSAEHHITKQSIQKNARHVIYLETPLLGRNINNKNDYEYYRVGVNGFLNGEGIFYSDTARSRGRLLLLQRRIGQKFFTGWKDHSLGNILVLAQLPGDASLRGQRISEWMLDTLDRIRDITDRPVVMRLHPALSQKGQQELLSELGPVLLKNHAAVTWSDGKTRSLEQDLSDAGWCVTFSSGGAVDAITQGVPVIAQDYGCLAYPVANHWIEDINNPTLATDEQITEWLVGLSNSQWTAQEMRSGRVWKHLLPVIEEVMS